MARFRLGLCLLLLSCADLFVSCVSAEVTLFDPGRKPLPPIPPESVQVFMSQTEVPEPFERIALISTHGDAGLTNVAQTIEAARKKAAALGANAILVGSLREPGAGEALGAKTVSSALSGDRRGLVTALRLLPSRSSSEAPRTFATPPPPPGYEEVPPPIIKPGFRDLKWGDFPAENMVRRGMDAEAGGAVFVRPGDVMKVAEVPILSISYEFWDGRLRLVVISTNVEHEGDLFTALKNAWGGPAESYPEFASWGAAGEATGAIFVHATKRSAVPSVRIFDLTFFVNGQKTGALKDL